MINLRKLVLFIAIITMFVDSVKAYDHEVWEDGNTYYWKINGVEAGSSASLSTAISSCIGSNREVHVLTSGTLNSTLTVRSANVKLYCHDNTLTCNFTGSGIINNGNDGFEIHDLTLRNVVGGYGIRCSGASDLSFVNVRVIDIDWIGMRIDSRSSNPWNYTIYNLYMRDCRFENTGSHGLETYGIDGINLEGTMTARNNGECGVLLNQTRNGTIDVVDAYNSAWGTGYAGLRYANACQNITTDQLYADRCGRGFFLVQSGPTVNCHVNYAEVRECSNIGIWIENGTNCSVKAGCSESGVSVSGSGSYADVSENCDVAPDCNGTPGGSAYLDNCNRCVEGNTGIAPCATSLNEGIYRIHPMHSNLCLADNNPSTQENCADVAAQYWEVTRDGDNYQIRSLGNDQYLSTGSGVQGENTGMSTSAVSLSLGDAGNGNYYLQSADNPALVFDVLDVSTAVGEPTILWENTGADNQRFRFESVTIVLDCNRDINGSATLDACGVCAGGNSGNTACAAALQGEDFCEGVGVSESDNAGFMGEGYFNSDNATGSSGTWYLNSSGNQSVTLGIRYANGGTDARPMTIHINGNQQGSLNGSATGAWTTWQSESINLNLEDGVNTMVLTSTTVNGGPNIDLFALPEGVVAGGCTTDCHGTIGGNASPDLCGICSGGNTGIEPNSLCVQEPFFGTPHSIPGIIQAQDYDKGGEGLGYHEANTNGNEGGATYRTDEVDIEATQDTDGDYNIGYTLTGEWLEYTVNVLNSGNYDLDIRVAKDGDGGLFHIEIDGEDVTGAIEVPNTGGWQVWETITLNNLMLTTGEHIMRIVFDTDYTNLNYVEFSDLVTAVLSHDTEQGQLYPNPITHQSVYRLEGTFNYKIIDSRGLIIKAGESSEQLLLDNELPAGLYLLKVQKEENHIDIKFIKN